MFGYAYWLHSAFSPLKVLDRDAFATSDYLVNLIQKGCYNRERREMKEGLNNHLAQLGISVGIKLA
jgi:hypothetical protein